MLLFFLLFWLSLPSFLILTSCALPLVGETAAAAGDVLHHKRDYSISTNGKSIMRREFTQDMLQNGWEVIHESLTLVLPPETFVRLLTDLYLEIMDHAIRDWSISPEHDHFIIAKGMFQLEFWSPTGPITWNWVRDFAMTLINMSNLGYSGTYNAIFLNSKIGSEIVVALRMMGGAAQIEE